MEGKEEINWHSQIIYVDLETGEVISKEDAIREYIIKRTKKETHVYKTTGTIKYTNECWRSPQLKIQF